MFESNCLPTHVHLTGFIGATVNSNSSLHLSALHTFCRCRIKTKKGNRASVGSKCWSQTNIREYSWYPEDVCAASVFLMGTICLFSPLSLRSTCQGCNQCKVDIYRAFTCHWLPKKKKTNPPYQSFIFNSALESPPFTHIMLELLALTNTWRMSVSDVITTVGLHVWNDPTTFAHKYLIVKMLDIVNPFCFS